MTKHKTFSHFLHDGYYTRFIPVTFVYNTRALLGNKRALCAKKPAIG